jgi:hypothetical protein
MRKELILEVLLCVCILFACGKNKTTEDKTELYEVLINSRVRIDEWTDTGFAGTVLNDNEVLKANEKILVNMSTVNGTVVQKDGSVYPYCRYGFDAYEDSARVSNSKRAEDWNLVSYSKWEGHTYVEGDEVNIEYFVLLGSDEPGKPSVEKTDGNTTVKIENVRNVE